MDRKRHERTTVSTTAFGRCDVRSKRSSTVRWPAERSWRKWGLAGAALFVLVVTTVVSIYKPLGMTPYAQRALRRGSAEQ